MKPYELIERSNSGEIKEEISMDKARFVDTLTDIQPIKVIYDLCRLMIEHSLQNGKGDYFNFKD